MWGALFYLGLDPILLLVDKFCFFGKIMLTY